MKRSRPTGPVRITTIKPLVRVVTHPHTSGFTAPSLPPPVSHTKPSRHSKLNRTITDKKEKLIDITHTPLPTPSFLPFFPPPWNIHNGVRCVLTLRCTTTTTLKDRSGRQRCQHRRTAREPGQRSVTMSTSGRDL